MGRSRCVQIPKDGRSKLIWIADTGRATRDRAILDLTPDFARLAQGFDIGRLLDVLPVLTEPRLISRSGLG